jgi:beta-lactamase regulating signal transducer with metallopeptidase domain
MVEHLDQQELEAVLAHELEHVAQHDYLINWLAIVLRDAFFYLPTSRIAYRQFAYEKELACDDLAIRTTRRPLALASAITKIWLSLSEGPPSPLVQSLVLTNESIEMRIERLLAKHAPDMSSQQRSVLVPEVKASIGILLGVIGVSVVLMLALLKCWPGIAL